MRKIFKIILLTVIFLSLAKTSYAQSIAGSSARLQSLTYRQYANLSINKIYRIKKAMKYIFEKYHSPLVSEIDTFILACQTYKLDCYLLPSIAGLESTFGRFIYPASYNPFGWGGGYIIFSDWKKGIETAAAGLRENYLNQGASTIWSIGRIYSESPTWATRVQYFINEFNRQEENLPLFLEENSVEL